jgi:hypothetical protein
MSCATNQSSIRDEEETAEHAEIAWFDKLTMSAHPEPVEGCELRGFF